MGVKTKPKHVAWKCTMNTPTQLDEYNHKEVTMRDRFGYVFRQQLPIWLVLPLLGLTLVLGLGGGYAMALRVTTPCPEAQEVCSRFANFWQAWDIAAANYVDPKAIDPEKMTDGAIS